MKRKKKATRFISLKEWKERKKMLIKMARLIAAITSVQCALEGMRTAMCNYPPGGYVPKE